LFANGMSFKIFEEQRLIGTGRIERLVSQGAIA
jgi:hypothetical protein